MQSENTTDFQDTVQQVASPSGHLVPAILNAVAVINYLNKTRTHGVTASELARSLAFTKSHSRSILRTLLQAGWVRFDERSKSYALDPSLIASVSSLLTTPAPAGIKAPLYAERGR